MHRGEWSEDICPVAHWRIKSSRVVTQKKKKKKVREKRGRELEVKLGGVEGGVSNETREKCGGQRNLDKTERKQRKEKV